MRSGMWAEGDRPLSWSTDGPVSADRGRGRARQPSEPAGRPALRRVFHVAGPAGPWAGNICGSGCVVFLGHSALCSGQSFISRDIW